MWFLREQTPQRWFQLIFVAACENQGQESVKTEKLVFRTIKDAAKAAKELFEYHSKTDKREAFHSFRIEVISRDNPLYEAMSEMMWEKPGMDEDSKYSFTVEALDHLLDSSAENVEDLQDEVVEWADNDTDVYTSDLTGWLHRSDYNVAYMTDAASEYGETDGFKLLMLAQFKAREEVYQIVIDTLERFLDDSEEE